MTETFKNVKVGDKVYSIGCGNGTVESVTGINYDYHFRVEFKMKRNDSKIIIPYTIDGKMDAFNEIADLYWGKPEIIAPGKPKKMVKVEENVWINCYKRRPKSIHLTEAEANSRRLYLHTDPIPGILTYEIEES